MREEKALLKMRSKDPDGLKALMDRYIPYVSAIVWNILRAAMTSEDAEEVVSDVFLAAWDQAVDSLPPEDREIFLRHYYYVQQVSEISEKMGLNASTVKTRLRRGRMKLKEFLTGSDKT